MFSRIVIVFLCCLALLSCKNDLHLNAPYKEIPSIYAVLNPQEQLQVIRVNKVFLGEGNANEMAQVQDSVNYPAGELEITLTRFEKDAQVNASTDGDRVITFRDSSVVTAQGAFNRNQRIYVTGKRLYTSGEYRLQVKNRKTGNVFTAKANSLDSIRSGYRPLTHVPSYPYDVVNTVPDEYIQYDVKNGTARFTPNGGKMYQLLIRTHYIDSGNFGKTYEYVDYEFGTRDEKSKQVVGSQTFIVFDFRLEDYWAAVGQALRLKNPRMDVYGRRVYMIQYFVYATTQEYVDYLQYTAPSFGLTQNSAIYSNFDDKAAIGLFTFRSRYSVRKQPSSTMVNEFSRNPNTCNYRFYTSDLQVLGCR